MNMYLKIGCDIVEQISNSELIIMRIIWNNNNMGMYADVKQALETQDLHWEKNTVLTFLSRLVDKKILTIKKNGRKNEYHAIVTEDNYRSSQTENFVGKVYEGNVKGLVSTLFEKQLLSNDDIEELQDLLKDFDSKND